MINIYIKELEKQEFLEFYKLPKWTRKFAWKIVKILNLILRKEIDENKKIYFIPNIEKESVYKKVCQKLEKEKTQTQKIQIILSKKLKQYKEYLKQYKIVDGKQSFIKAVEEILLKVLEENPLQMQDIYILTNRYCEQSIFIIKKLSQKVKTMNIITKEIEKYKTLEEMLGEKGIAICIANNKKKSLKRAKIIINIDFSKEELSKYAIFRNALIINIAQDKLTNLKGFEGIIVQDIEVYFKENKVLNQNGLFENFRQLEIYESISNSNEKIQISKLYGNNGQISEKELRNWQKILTN